MTCLTLDDLDFWGNKGKPNSRRKIRAMKATRIREINDEITIILVMFAVGACDVTISRHDDDNDNVSDNLK